MRPAISIFRNNLLTTYYLRFLFAISVITLPNVFPCNCTSYWNGFHGVFNSRFLNLSDFRQFRKNSSVEQFNFIWPKYYSVFILMGPIFFPAQCLFAPKAQKGIILRVNDLGGGWRTCILAYVVCVYVRTYVTRGHVCS